MQAKIEKVERIDFISKVLWLISFPLNYFFLKHTSNGHLLNSYFFPEFSPLSISLDDSSRWMMVRLFLAKVGAFIFFNMFTVFLCRVATKRIAPAMDEDPVVIKFFNRILQNSLEQLAIFGCLYIYFLFDKAGDRFTVDQLLVFGSWFLYGRIVFLLSYGLGTYLNMVAIRAFGFGVHMILNFMLVELCFCPSTPICDHLFGM